MTPRLMIFSRPVHSGKTSELIEWASLIKDKGGILMPDINGYRKFLNLSNNEIIEAEADSTLNTTEEITEVGPYRFYFASFKKANEILYSCINPQPSWIIIDEVGKLELDNRGLYEGTGFIIDQFKNGDLSSNLLLVVRQGLVKQVISHFQLTDPEIVDSLTDLR